MGRAVTLGEVTQVLDVDLLALISLPDIIELNSPECVDCALIVNESDRWGPLFGICALDVHGVTAPADEQVRDAWS